jgi:phage-related holin
MTPSNELTLQGFLQGLQGNMMWLFGSIIAIVVILMIARWFIKKIAREDREDGIEEIEVKAALSRINRTALVFVLIMVALFCINATMYATNTIPRSELDRSSINRDMDANIKR